MEYKQNFTEEEMKALSDKFDTIIMSTYSIGDLADMATVLSQMSTDKSIDQCYLDQLCGPKGIQTLTDAIKSLSQQVAEAKEEADSILEGIWSAEFEGRRQYINGFYRRKAKQSA